MVNIMLSNSRLVKIAGIQFFYILLNLAPAISFAGDQKLVQLRCKGEFNGIYLGGINKEERRDEKVVFNAYINERMKQVKLDLNALTGAITSPYKCDFLKNGVVDCKYHRESTQTMGKPPMKELLGTDFDFTGQSLSKANISINTVTGVMSYSGESLWIQTEPKQITIKSTERGTFQCGAGEGVQN